MVPAPTSWTWMTSPRGTWVEATAPTSPGANAVASAAVVRVRGSVLMLVTGVGVGMGAP